MKAIFLFILIVCINWSSCRKWMIHSKVYWKRLPKGLFTEELTNLRDPTKDSKPLREQKQWEAFYLHKPEEIREGTCCHNPGRPSSTEINGWTKRSCGQRMQLLPELQPPAQKELSRGNNYFVSFSSVPPVSHQCQPLLNPTKSLPDDESTVSVS